MLQLHQCCCTNYFVFSVCFTGHCPLRLIIVRTCYLLQLGYISTCIECVYESCVCKRCTASLPNLTYIKWENLFRAKLLIKQFFCNSLILVNCIFFMLCFLHFLLLYLFGLLTVYSIYIYVGHCFCCYFYNCTCWSAPPPKLWSLVVAPLWMS